MNQPFERILIVMFENQYRSYVMQDRFMQKLTKAGADMSNYFGAFHPSQTNYIASLAGEVCAKTNDIPPIEPLKQKNLVDLMEAANVSWKAYMEALPNEAWNPDWAKPSYPAEEQPITQYPQNDPNNLARYFRKHNAFASFQTIQSDKSRWGKIVNEAEFWRDVENDTLPQYSWFTPDIWNDGHYLYNTHIDTNPRTQLIPQMSTWLEHIFFGEPNASKIQYAEQSGLPNIGLNLDIDLLLSDPDKAWAQSNVPKGTLIVVTFDEADYNADGYDTNYDGPNQVYTVLLGDMITPGTSFDRPYNHYSLIKTIEKNFALGDLGKNDRDANWFRPLWKDTFEWNACQQVKGNNNLPIATGAKQLASTALESSFHLLIQNTEGFLQHLQLETSVSKTNWLTLQEPAFSANGPMALTTLGETLHLVFADAQQRMLHATYTQADGWSQPCQINTHCAKSIALTSYHDIAANDDKLMLCWCEPEEQAIKSLRFINNEWQLTATPVSQFTDGDMTLTQFGPSLFLVYKERNTRQMRMTSYNVAKFNAFDAEDFNGDPAPENATTLHQWAVTDFAVGNFAGKLAATQNCYRAMGQLAMTAIEGEMHLLHRGGYKDLPQIHTSVFGLTGVYTASNQDSNGYGTLDQAGWTPEEVLSDMQMAEEAPLTAAALKETILTVWLDEPTKEVNFRLGGYNGESSF